MKGFYFLVLASLASFSIATSLNLDKRASALDVKLDRISNSVVKISVTNTGAKDLRLLNEGTLIDSRHTEKIHVFSNGKQRRTVSCLSSTLFADYAAKPVFACLSDDLLSGETYTM